METQYITKNCVYICYIPDVLNSILSHTFNTKNNHTNIILANIPYRYDTTNTSTVNDSIEKFNRRLEKLVKVSPHASFLKTEQNRKLYTIITDWENNTFFIK